MFSWLFPVCFPSLGDDQWIPISCWKPQFLSWWIWYGVLVGWVFSWFFPVCFPSLAGHQWIPISYRKPQFLNLMNLIWSLASWMFSWFFPVLCPSLADHSIQIPISYWKPQFLHLMNLIWSFSLLNAFLILHCFAFLLWVICINGTQYLTKNLVAGDHHEWWW